MVDVEVAPWLASLPLAPVYHPSEAEFADPVAYILKIERQAAQYGICKIVPPFPRAPDETALSNLNQSLAAIQEGAGPSSAHGASVPLARSMCSAVQDAGVPVTSSSSPSLSAADSAAKFTTRRQQLGWNPRRPRGGSQYRAQKLVWESGEYYTLEQFQDKARSFSSTVLGTLDDVNALAVETLFWNAEMDKPISVEYANDIPGSAFLDPCDLPESKPGAAAGEQLAASGWNVRNIARSHGSLLKFMADEVPGVTTPMVYLGMLFSWFAWHVEDHELHSLNYLHSGARKTWYAVPSEAAAALEEVIRLYGYGSRLSARAAFTLLGEKTTILSPEILLAAGVPCCRLEQNPGEYVITFPRAYHLGFSHGFNCGEAANFATPEWLGVAREAAARRAAMNHLPMLSHEQLLYLTMMTLPREGRSLVDHALKSAFVAEVKEANGLTSKLLRLGVESCVFVKDLKNLPQHAGCARDALNMQTDNVPGPSDGTNASPSLQENGSVVCVESRAFSPERYDSVPEEQQMQIAPFATPWGALPCSTCGILCFAGMALVQPCAAQVVSIKQRKPKVRPEPASHVEDDRDPDLEGAEAAPRPPACLSSAAFSGICRLNSAHNDEDPNAVDLAETISLSDDNAADCSSSPNSGVEAAVNKASSAVPVAAFAFPSASRSALELLAETYREDSEDDWELSARPDGVIASIAVDEVGLSMDAPWSVARSEDQPEAGPSLEASISNGDISMVLKDRDAEVIEVLDTAAGPEVVLPAAQRTTTDAAADQGYLEAVCSFNCESSNVFSASDKDEEELADMEVAETPSTAERGDFELCASNREPTLDGDSSRANKMSWKFFKGFPRPFMFCLQHAVQAVALLQPFGGATVLVLCHSNHQIIQKAAEEIASETWERIPLREASPEEVEIINTAIHLKPDNTPESNWFLKLGIVNRARKHRVNGGEGFKVGLAEEQQHAVVGNVVAVQEKGVLGSWCGMQWGASQVHPLLGGGKISSQMLSQILRKCDAGKYQKRLQIHRNGFARLVSLAKSSLAEKCPKRTRKEGWEGQDRVLTAAILRKSKRNAVLKTAREQAEGRRKKLEREEPQLQSTLTQPGLCSQAVLSLDSRADDRQQGLLKEEQFGKQPGPLVAAVSCSTSPASGSCHRNQSEVDSTTDAVKWHEVPVACSPSIRPPQLWPSDHAALCGTSQQDTAPEDGQAWNSEEQLQESSKLVLRVKRRNAGRLSLKSKKLRSECDQNLEETPEPAVEGEADETAHSTSDEYSLRTDEVDSEADSPKVLPCFTSRRKCRSRSKLRVKRATWDNLLSRLPDQGQKEEPQVAVQNQDSCPMSCVTEAEYSYLCEDVYRPKLRRRASGLQGDKPSPAKEDTAPAAKPKRGGGSRKAVVELEETEEANKPFPCDIEGCIMSFCTEQELVQHKKNKCTYKGCGKRFFSHKYLVQHRRVHMDDRPLKCPWEGCSMAFKWAWARTEHIRVHTGERPYACPECDKTFRFVSDFSRHKRNTGHARA